MPVVDVCFGYHLLACFICLLVSLPRGRGRNPDSRFATSTLHPISVQVLPQSKDGCTVSYGTWTDRTMCMCMYVLLSA